VSRVFWLGDAGCTTGFGRVTHSIAERLVTDHGDDVHVLAVNYDGDFVDTPLKLYRANKNIPNDMYGQSRFVEMLSVVDPDVVIIQNDPHVVLKFLFDNNWDEEHILLRRRPILAYMPVDGYEHPTSWDVMRNVLQPVVMSKHGRTVFPDAPLVYHGIDRTVFHSLAEGPLTSSTGVVVSTQTEAKKIFGYDPDGFLILRVDRNSVRKDFADTWRAIVPLAKKFSDIQVHFHCVVKDEGANLAQLITRSPETEKQFYFPGGVNTFRGWPEADLAILYAAADVFVSTSMGEGFGLTLLESISCGTPVIAQGVSSIPEVVGPGGLLIDSQRHFTVANAADVQLPNVPEFTAAIQHAYQSSGLRRKLGEAGVNHAKSFSWDIAAAKFHALIGDAASRPSTEEEHDGSEIQDSHGIAEGIPV